MRMSGKVAVVTGAGRGIGRATAIRFAHEGAVVAAASLCLEHAARTVEEIRRKGGTGLAIGADISQPDEVLRLVHTTMEAYGRIDVLVNNAGVFRSGTVVDASPEDWHRIISVNLLGMGLCMKYAIPEMVRNGGGAVVNVSSEAGLSGAKGMAAYSASKGAVIALTRSTALDFVRDGVRVNCICPGRTVTDMVEQHIAESADPEEARRELSTDRPMLRMGTVDEIASAILFLASDEASYATGAVLAVDGGFSL